MGAFASFIESDAFFPILILLSVLLMFIFISVLMSGKKNNKKRLQERKKIKIDENAQVQLVQDNVNNMERKKDENNELDKEVETGGQEVNLFTEEESIVENADLKEIEPEVVNVNLQTENEKSEENLELDINENHESTRVSENTITTDLSDTEVNIPPFAMEREDLNNQYNIPHENASIENIDLKEKVDIGKTYPLETNLDIGESVTIPNPELEDTKNEIPVINVDEKLENVSNAFDKMPTDDFSINEDIKSEMPHEYVGEKTEILEFPDFDSLNNETKDENIEEKIIDAANKYIESIMNR